MDSVTRFSKIGFFFHQTIPPGPLIHGLKPRYDRFSNARHRIYANFLLGSPFKCFCSGGLGPFGNIDGFDIYSRAARIGLCMWCHILHAVSMTPHESCMRCQWHRTSILKKEFLREFEFIFEKALGLNQGSRTDVLMKKNRGLKISWHCPFKVPVSRDAVLILLVYS
jgi:hypothetical protein